MRPHHYRPRLEALETRLTPAGNVTAVLAGGTLTLTGDAQDNAIAVTQSAPSSFTISSDDGTTTINGGADAVTITGVTRDLRVLLDGGNDRLEHVQDAFDDGVFFLQNCGGLHVCFLSSGGRHCGRVRRGG